MWSPIVKSDGELMSSNGIGGYYTHYQVPRDPLMQYTGLVDKNDTPVYEGDVVRCELSFNGGFLPHMGEIVYVDEYGAFATKNEAGETLLHNHLQSSFEVIGNNLG